MRNVKSMTLGLIATSALLAAAPPAATTTRPTEAAVRAIEISLPGGPVAQPGSSASPEIDASNIYQRLALAAGMQGHSYTIHAEAASRLPKGVDGTKANLDMQFSELAPSLVDGRITARLFVRPTRDGEPGVVDQLADKVAEVINDRVIHTWDEILHMYKESLPKVEKQAADATAQLAKARKQVAAGEAQLRERTGRIDLSAAGMQATADALELERQKVELDVAGLKARREALQEAIADQSKKADAARTDDVAAQALAKAVEVSKKRLAQVQAMYQRGQANSGEVGDAELAVMQAEAQLAERRNAVGGTADALAQWTRALTEAAIEQREKEARLAAASKNLGALVEATARQQDLNDARTAETNAAEQLATAERRLRTINAWLQRYGDDRPVVRIRRATPATAPAGE